jgi:hypothetical protein
MLPRGVNYGQRLGIDRSEGLCSIIDGCSLPKPVEARRQPVQLNLTVGGWLKARRNKADQYPWQRAGPRTGSDSARLHRRGGVTNWLVPGVDAATVCSRAALVTLAGCRVSGPEVLLPMDQPRQKCAGTYSWDTRARPEELYYPYLPLARGKIRRLLQPPIRKHYLNGKNRRFEQPTQCTSLHAGEDQKSGAARHTPGLVSTR